MELRRRRFNKAVRLEVSESDERRDARPARARARARTRPTCTAAAAPIDLGCLWQLHGLDRPDLKDRPWPPVTAGRIAVAEEADRPLVSVMRDRAIFVHHPYESFASSTEAFIEQAADDPRVQTHQDDAVPRRRRQPDHPQPDPGRRARRAGRRARRAEGPLRRGDQRQLGQAARARRRPRRVRHGRAEDALQVRARRARRRRPAAPLLPHRHRQLQHQDGPPVRGPRASSRATPTSAPTSPSCSTTSPATAAATSYQHAARRAARPAAASCSS